MEPVSMEIDSSQQLYADPLPFARSYQLEALDMAVKGNTIVFLETGSGKTLIAIMLLRSYAHLLRKPSRFVAVFLVPKVVLVSQQAEAVKMHTDLKVGTYCGDMGVDFWSNTVWKEEMGKNEVLVMTPAILLEGLRHSFFKLSMIKVLIIDECHHARGKHPYACIMTEFYHCQMNSSKSDLPRIFGMTASPIKTKSGESESSFWQKICELETLMNSKVYTCASEAVLAKFIPFATTKFKVYQCKEIQSNLYQQLAGDLHSLREKHVHSLKMLDLGESATDATSKRIKKMFSALIFCLDELGIWLSLKAAQTFSCDETDICNEMDICNDTDLISWGKLDVLGQTIVKNFCLAAFNAFATYIPSDADWCIGNNIEANVDGGLVTSKVVCLIESLLEYRELEDIRCIVFVERVITAIVLNHLLNELLPKYNSCWKSKYIAGSNSGLQFQTRKKQDDIVEEFRKGMVNIIVATSILEEGLDVQSCNLVIRFDPSSTVCSFIQSRGRARMKNSDYILMVKSGDIATRSRLEKYLASGDIMRRASLRHASLPSLPLPSDINEEEVYRVEQTGATVTLTSSVGLIHFYCSRLPSDCYFKPAPRWDASTCTLYLPKNCPLEKVVVQRNINPRIVKQTACLEACKELHKIGALTDYLVPDIVLEEADVQEHGSGTYTDEQPSYFPPELVGCRPKESKIMYHCYLIELKRNFSYDVPVHEILLFMRSELDSDVGRLHFDLEVDRGSLTVSFKYAGVIHLDQDLVLLCRRFQMTLLRILIDRNLSMLKKLLDGDSLGDNVEIDYLLLPASGKGLVDWQCVDSVFLSCEKFSGDHSNCSLPKDFARRIQTKDGSVCTCLLRNSLVYTPHNGYVYCITGILGLNGNSLLKLRDGRCITYRKYYKEKHGIELRFGHESLLNGRRVFQVQNHLQRCRKQKDKESSNATVELPPELCSIIMSPISIATFYTFSFVPSIMHRLESLLLAVNLRKMHLDHCTQNVVIPTIKVLEAITTKKCQEAFHLESLETLGDSFLKYATSQQLFKTYQNQHEGFLSMKREKIISNAALCKFGCDRKLPGFIRNEPFDPKKWMIPGDRSGSYTLSEDLLLGTRKIYVGESRKMKSKRVADVVEALIGAFLSSGGEMAAILFMDWMGIKVDFQIIPYERHFQVRAEKVLNVRHLESLLNYSFRDPSLLVEALTHGSYMLPEIPRSYQRLEFLGDSVLDYLVTMYFYRKYPSLSPELLTDMRSATTNNDCYARSAVKFELHKHILHLSQPLHRHIVETVKSFDKLSNESTFGWESETTFPKVLGDVIESLAGAILVDSGFRKEIVFQSMMPLLEPLITPETVTSHPAKELNELCQKMNYKLKEPIKSRNQGTTSITIEVVANGNSFKRTVKSADKRIAKKLASKEVLKALKQQIQ